MLSLRPEARGLESWSRPPVGVVVFSVVGGSVEGDDEDGGAVAIVHGTHLAIRVFVDDVNGATTIWTRKYTSQMMQIFCQKKEEETNQGFLISCLVLVILK